MGKPSCKHLLHSQVLIALKEIIPTYGKRLKVYSAIKSKLEVNPIYNNCINLPGTNYVCLGREQFYSPLSCTFKV